MAGVMPGVVADGVAVTPVSARPGLELVTELGDGKVTGEVTPGEGLEGQRPQVAAQ